MTGDRKLTEEEKQLFRTHRFNALETVINSGDEPTLFEVALIEIASNLGAHRETIITIARDVKKLAKMIK